MLLAQVEGFVEIARQGNLSRAALALHITQPALTARIHGLEAEVGVPLFARGRRGMELTDAGRAFLPYAERALAALDDGSNLLGDLGRGYVGELVLGAAPAVGTYVLPGVLVRFVARFPRVRLVVRTGHSEEILDMAIRNDIQVGLVRELRHPLIESVPLYDDEIVLVAQPGHPFAAVPAIGLRRITEDRLILFDRTSSYYDLTNTLFRQAGVAPRGVMELDNIDAAKHMVYQGLGVAFLPRTAVTRELGEGRLTAIRIADAAPIRRRIVAIRRQDLGPPTGIVAGFLDVLAEDVAVHERTLSDT
ncbi:MAG: LysR family transcriptional regulator [Chloroflexota bacterium]